MTTPATLVPPKTLAPPKTRAQTLRSYVVGDFPALTGREEEWRFTPLKRLRGLATSNGATADGSLEAGSLPKHEYGQLPAGVTVSTVERSDARVGRALTPFDRISALAYGRAERALVISVAREALVAEPAVVKLVGAGAEAMSYGHTVLDIGEVAEATIVLEQNGSITLADNVEGLVGAGARL